MQLYKQLKAFSQFLLHFQKLHLILNISKKNMRLIAKVFPML